MANASADDRIRDFADIARRIGLEVRHVRVGGAGGGVARLKGQRILFIDLDADPEEEAERLAEQLAALPEAQMPPVSTELQGLRP